MSFIPKPVSTFGRHAVGWGTLAVFQPAGVRQNKPVGVRQKNQQQNCCFGSATNKNPEPSNKKRQLVSWRSIIKNLSRVKTYSAST